MKISACIIARDEEKNLPRLLRSIVGKFDEIILVDTGSTDRTVTIAKEFGCKVIHHEWNGFADARNRAVKEATGDWIWHFDADFELEDEEYRKAILYLKRIPEKVDAILIGVKNFDNLGRVKGISSQIFIHRKGIYWNGKVHESVNATHVIGLPIYVNHYGYADYKIQIAKALRNLKLLQDEIKELKEGEKKYNIKLFYLVQTYSILSYEEKGFLEKVIERAEEFLQAIKGKEYEYRFFSLYVYNYLLNALERLENWDLYEKYLLEILQKKSGIPDFYLKAFSFFKRKKEYEKALFNLIQVAELLDEAERNLFKLGVAFATDRMLEFYEIVISQEIEEYLKKKFEALKDIEDKWKKTRGKNLGLLLANAYENDRKKKFLRKLALRYKSDDFVVFTYLDFLYRNSPSELEKELSIFSDQVVSLFFRAILLERKGDRDKALKLYHQYLKLKKDPFVAKYLLINYPKLREVFEKRTKKG